MSATLSPSKWAEQGKQEHKRAPKTFKNLIDGEWVESRSGKTYENTNPADTRDVVGYFQRSGKEDVDAAVDAAGVPSSMPFGTTQFPTKPMR